MSQQHVPLSTALGELMAPQTLVTALVVSPDGTVALDPGALHGRSQLEAQVEFVKQPALLADGKTHWIAWVAIELDAANQPVRYKGLAVSELLINPDTRRGYKSVAGSTNRMSEAIRGGVNLATLKPELLPGVKRQLLSINLRLWEEAPESLKQAFGP